MTIFRREPENPELNVLNSSVTTTERVLGRRKPLAVRISNWPPENSRSSGLPFSFIRAMAFVDRLGGQKVQRGGWRGDVPSIRRRWITLTLLNVLAERQYGVEQGQRSRGATERRTEVPNEIDEVGWRR
ncbi:MAG TPA: hypothetical protein VGK29_27020 [Paludibaculum sp.]|jgi:hypothetical protein